MKDRLCKTTHAGVFLRVALAFVFFWFGFHQLFEPTSWTFFLPDFISGMGFNEETFVQVNGFAEVVLATLLLIGFKTRIVAWILAMHMVAVAVHIGGAIGVRDFGIAAACFALGLLSEGDDAYSVDVWLKKRS